MITRALIVLSLVAVSTGAHADKRVAKDLYEEGTRYYDLNDFRSALDYFKRAYLEYEEPSFLYNIALCHRGLGQKSDAVLFLRSYLRKLPDAPNRADVEHMIVALQEQQRPPPPHGKPEPPRPPVATPPLAQPKPAPSLTTAIASRPPAPRKPIYKRWWLWTLTGTAAAGLAVGLTFGLSDSRSENRFAAIHVSP